jgi:thiamine biosynthesis lipoprotein
MGVATSGDYFNFFRVGGQNYSHVIDPTTGWPIQHEVVSVTVVEQSVTRADGLATGLLVLGKDKALALAEENQWAVLILARTEEGIESFPSSEFARLYQ